jgi:hypothetical protein
VVPHNGDMPATKYVAGFSYTAAELLALVNEAIARIQVSGQEYWIGQRRYRAADLPELRALRTELQAETAAESSQGMVQNLARINRR